jgi:hypothetical protein
MGITNPYEYLPPLMGTYRSRNSTKRAQATSAKQKAKQRKAKRNAQRHNRKK